MHPVNEAAFDRYNRLRHKLILKKFRQRLTPREATRLRWLTARCAALMDEDMVLALANLERHVQQQERKAARISALVEEMR